MAKNNGISPILNQAFKTKELEAKHKHEEHMYKLQEAPSFEQIIAQAKELQQQAPSTYKNFNEALDTVLAISKARYDF